MRVCAPGPAGGRRRRYERSNVLVTGGGTGQRNRYALSLLCDRQILQEASTGQGWLLPDLGQDVDTQVKALRQHVLSLRWKYDDVERRLRISEVSRILRRGDFLYFHCCLVPSRFRFVCATKALTLLACN